MTKKTLLLNATILLPQLVVAQSAELNEAYKKAQKYTASENQSRPTSYWL